MLCISSLPEKSRTRSSQLQSMYSNRDAAQLLLESGMSSLFDLSHPSLSDLKQHFGVGNGVTGTEAENALVAYQALTNGVSRCVTYRAARGLDSHNGDDWATRHGPRLQNGFNSVAALATLLEDTPIPSGGSWLSRTTIWCMSEFQRNPVMNNNFGRDHYITNSALLLGGGLPGGTVIGATSDTKMKSQRSIYRLDRLMRTMGSTSVMNTLREHCYTDLESRMIWEIWEPPIQALL